MFRRYIQTDFISGKIKTNSELSIYKLSSKKIKIENLNIFNINPKNEFKDVDFSKDKEVYCYTDEELAEVTNSLKNKNYTLQRYKGLGEMSTEQLWSTTMDPSKRNLIRVTLEDVMQADKEITLWMGDDVAPRKDYINKYANFNKIDTFDKKLEDEDKNE